MREIDEMLARKLQRRRQKFEAWLASSRRRHEMHRRAIVVAFLTAAIVHGTTTDHEIWRRARRHGDVF